MCCSDEIINHPSVTQQTSPHQSCTHDPTKMGAYWFVSRTRWTAASHTGTKRNLQAITFPIWAIYKSIRPLVPIFFFLFFFFYRRDWPLFLLFLVLSVFIFAQVAPVPGDRRHARTRAHVGSPGPPFKLNQHLCVNSCRTNTHRGKKKKKKRKPWGGPVRRSSRGVRSVARTLFLSPPPSDPAALHLSLSLPPSLSLSLSLSLSPSFLKLTSVWLETW